MIAQSYLTASKSQYPENTPLATYGEGVTLVTPSGKTLTDYVCGLGANITGSEVTLSLPTPYPKILAEKILNILPWAESIKILKTGTDACNLAVRIAREKSGKLKGVGTGYHGWGDTFISAEEPGAGCLPGHYKKYANFKELIKALKNGRDIGFCIVEPVELDLDVKSELEEIREICSKNGIILIFDEIVTGFRVPDYFICNWFEIEPDLICIGKGMAGGFPLSVVAGKNQLMEGEYFASGTFFEEIVSLTRAISLLDNLSRSDLKQLWKEGQRVQDEFNLICPFIQLYGYPTRAIWKGEQVFICTFAQQMIEKGYIIHPRTWMIGLQHSRQINDKFLKTAKEVIESIIQNNIQLKGDLPKPIFKR